MRRFQRKQLLEHIHTLREAGCALGEQFGEKKINLCADMQEFIAAILGFLDSIGEDDSALADKLAQLYGLLLQVSQDKVSSAQITAQISNTQDYVECRASPDRL